jgi:hypothetical protein
MYPSPIGTNWTNTTLIRVATIRDPYDRFLSTLNSLQNAIRANRLGPDRPYLSFFNVNTTALELLQNKTSMQALIQGLASGHFLPMNTFVRPRHTPQFYNSELWSVHFLMNFSTLPTILSDTYTKITGKKVVSLNSKHVSSTYIRNEAINELIRKFYAIDTEMYEQLSNNTHPHCKKDLNVRGLWMCF